MQNCRRKPSNFQYSQDCLQLFSLKAFDKRKPHILPAFQSSRAIHSQPRKWQLSPQKY